MKRKAALPMVLVFLLGLAGCAGGESQAGKGISMETPELLEPVDVKMDMAMAQRGDLYTLSIYSGEIIPYTEELHFVVDGQLEDINVVIGDMVQEGDVLATLSEEQTVKQIESLQKEIDDLVKMGEFNDRQSHTDIAIAREELEYIKAQGGLGYKGWVKEVEIEQLELALKETQELRSLELEKRQESLNSLLGKIGKNEITAPYSGRIVYISNAKKGDWVQGYTPVIYIADDSRISLSAEYVSESAINSADRVFARIGARDYGITYIPYEGEEIIKAALSGEELKARFSIDAEVPELIAGQFAVVMVYGFYREDVLTIPINALYRDGGGQYVYREASGVRVRCAVKTGMTTNTKAEIIEGLEEGDIVYVQD